MIQKKKIGIVLNKVPAYSETFFYNKINGLIAKGFDVTVFADRDETEVPANWKVVSPYKLPSNKLVRLFLLISRMCGLLIGYSKSMMSFYKEEKKAGNTIQSILENLYINGHLLSTKVDWLHYGFATVALRRENVAKAIGAKMAVSFRGYDIAVYPLKNKECYKLLWTKVDKVHSISDDLMTRAYELGLPKEKTVVKITPAINYSQFCVARNVKNNDKLHILTIARLTWIKGLSYALHAMKLLKDAGIEFEYTIVGDGIEMENLVVTAHHLGISDQVVFTGKQNVDNIIKLLEHNTIYLQPSLQEGFCNAALEAQAAGLLTIVSDGGALKENVVDNITGWIVPRRDPQAIADAILNVLSMSEEHKEEIINNARKRVQADFTLEKQLDAFADFYQ